MTSPDPEIFVALAAYRDPELVATIESCQANAAAPERLRFGIHLQFDDERPGAERDCLDEVAFAREPRVIRVPADWSRGGCWARHHVQSLWDGEAYTLQVDSHTHFASGWDADLIDYVETLPDPKPLVTGFPPLYERRPEGAVLLEDAGLPVPVTVADHWSVDGWIHHASVPAPDSETHGPRRTRLLSGAFVFTLGAWNDEVRQDPEHLYTGEEFALALRSYTNGYDLWNPPHRIVWHQHMQGHRRYIGDDPDRRQAQRHERACRRLVALLDGDTGAVLGPYGLGCERTLEDFARFSGLDCATRTIHPDAIAGVAPDPIARQ